MTLFKGGCHGKVLLLLLHQCGHHHRNTHHHLSYLVLGVHIRNQGSALVVSASLWLAICKIQLCGGLINSSKIYRLGLQSVTQ